MSDWLKDVREDYNAWNAKVEELKKVQESTFRDLNPRVRPILLDAVGFLNGLRSYNYWRLDPYQEQYHGWEIDTDDGPTMFSLRVQIDMKKSFEENPRLVVDTRTGGPASEIRVSEFSDDWLKAKVLESVRHNTPRLPS